MTDHAVTRWANAPSCPRCGRNDDVERLPVAIGDAHQFCGRCDLVFTGSDREWRAYRKERDGASA